MKCPSCGGQLEVPVGRDRVFCRYCGTQILVDSHDVTVHVHNHASEAVELRRLEIEREERRKAVEKRERQEAENNRYRKRWRIALVAYFIVITTLMVITSSVKLKPLSTLGGGLILFGPIVFFVTRPGKREKRQRQN